MDHMTVMMEVMNQLSAVSGYLAYYNIIVPNIQCIDLIFSNIH